MRINVTDLGEKGHKNEKSNKQIKDYGKYHFAVG